MKTQLLACAALSVITTGIVFAATDTHRFSMSKNTTPQDPPRTQVIRIENFLGHIPNPGDPPAFKTDVSLEFFNKETMAMNYCWNTLNDPNVANRYLVYAYDVSDPLHAYEIFTGFSGGTDLNNCKAMDKITVTAKAIPGQEIPNYSPKDCVTSPTAKITHVILVEDTPPESTLSKRDSKELVTKSGTMKCIVSDENGFVEQPKPKR